MAANTQQAADGKNQMQKSEIQGESYEGNLASQFSALDTKDGANTTTTHPPYVFFDLETTGLNTQTGQITQISAICGNNKYNQYVLPTCSIDPAAAEVTKITMEDGRLCHNGKPVETLRIMPALESFTAWLKDQNSPLLLGHNAKRFDCPYLVIALKRMKVLDEFKAAITGFADTLFILKDHLPERHERKESFKLERLMKDLLGEKGAYGAHDASEDVRALQLLFVEQKVPHELVEPHIFSVDDIPEA